ncbi:MAG: hypothetical protein A2W19_10855 [Spirochaetes bacterium RBG_16_49_21]|nr:MAG: hypothetical protein A2W19_10855 [Spirochaetes bacterium RBG_16_49_21]
MRAYYKKIASMLLSLMIAVIVGSFAYKTANSKIITNVPADVSGDELMAVVVEDFENAQVGESGWAIQSMPKPFTSADTEKKLKMKNPVPIIEMKLISGSPSDMNVQQWSLTGMGEKKDKILGIHFKFRYPGTNEISILPPLEIHWKEKKPMYTFNPNTGKDEQERGLELPGQAREISVWIHARGLPYSLEAWLKDFKGNTYILKFGSVNFVGWRPLKVSIPASVPQTYESYPQTRITKITRFVLRADPSAAREELMQETFFFLDQIKVLSGTYEVNFDGQDLHKVFESGPAPVEKKRQ